MVIHQQSVLEVKNLAFGNGAPLLLADVSFELKKGEILSIVGPNGSGKSSLLRLILGFMKPSKGSVCHLSDRRYGYVPQHFERTSHIPLSVQSFLELTSPRYLLVEEVVKMTIIEPLLKKQLYVLSGGELRKVLLAKALLSTQDILFLDEPTCWLDEPSQQHFYELVNNFILFINCSVLIISHDSIFMPSFSDRVLYLYEGKLQAQPLDDCSFCHSKPHLLNSQIL